MSGAQLSWLDALAPVAEGPPAIDDDFGGARRIELDAALDGERSWLEVVPGWVRAHEVLFAELERTMRWRGEQRVMYERVVDVPRLFARAPEDGTPPSLVERMRACLSARYEAPLDAITMALYRGGADSVAWHRDRGHRDRVRSVVAVVSLGGPRRFLVRPWRAPGEPVRPWRAPGEPARGAASRALVIRGGDLVVMGGACQRTVEHSVPKVKHAEPRIALMFRHTAPIAERVELS